MLLILNNFDRDFFNKKQRGGAKKRRRLTAKTLQAAIKKSPILLSQYWIGGTGLIVLFKSL